MKSLEHFRILLLGWDKLQKYIFGEKSSFEM